MSGVVLAGGASSRFGEDKLEHELGSLTLLGHVLTVLAPLCAELVVLGPERASIATDGLGLGVPIRVVPDRLSPAGPLVALAGGLVAARGPVALVVAGDQPWLEPGLASLLVAELRDDADVAATALLDGNRVPPVPIAVRTDAASRAADRLVAAGERRLRALLAAVPTRIIPEARWRLVDRDGRSLLDVDTPADLESAPPGGTAGPATMPR